jgi:ATP-dependent Zn protease
VDEEIRTVVMNAYDHAKWIERNTETVLLMAEALLDQESIDADDIKAILERANAKL